MYEWVRDWNAGKFVAVGTLLPGAPRMDLDVRH